MMPRRMFIAFCGILASHSLVCAAAPPTLEHNPFARPPLSEIRVTRNADGDGLRSFEELQVKATMVSGVRRLANVNGRVMRAGEELYGYKLLRVFENRAVFVKNGNQTTVYVKPELEEDYDSGEANRDAD